MNIKVTSEEYHNGECLTWDDTGEALSKREGQAWWAGWDEGRKDGDADARDELEPEIERLREALRRLAALDEFVNGEPTSVEEVMNYTQYVARAALRGEE